MQLAPPAAGRRTFGGSRLRAGFECEFLIRLLRLIVDRLNFLMGYSID